MYNPATGAEYGAEYGGASSASESPGRGARRARHTVPSRAGGIARCELDDTLTEITRLIERAREAGYGCDPAAERTHLTAARAQLADFIDRLDDCITDLG